MARNLHSLRDLIAYVASRGYTAERVFNDMRQGADLRVVGLRLRGPRGNKGFVALEYDYGDLDSVALWRDGVDYGTRKIAERRAA
jgi:hypothetical protein